VADITEARKTLEKLLLDLALDPSRAVVLHHASDDRVALRALLDDHQDALNLAAEVAMGITHSTMCDAANDAPCMRCAKEQAESALAQVRDETRAERDHSIGVGNWVHRDDGYWVIRTGVPRG